MAVSMAMKELLGFSGRQLSKWFRLFILVY
jgi:hypothetical protein